MSTFVSILWSAFDWTWQTSFQTSVLIVLVMLLQRLLRRWLTPRLRHALSFLVLCRLLLPVAPPSSLSFENLLAPSSPPSQASPPATLASGSPREPVSLARAHGLSLGSALRICWIGGLLILGGLGVWRYCHWWKAIRNARQVLDAGLLKILDDVRKEVGIRRPVALVSLTHLSSPAVFGFWRLQLLLPETSLKSLSDQEWRLVFLHEMTHIRNYDTVLNTVLIVVQFLHWFNPVVWIGLQRLRADRELVCDAIVVERLKASERLGYAQVLLRLAEAISNGPRVFASAVPVVSTASEIKTRVTMIKYYRKSSRALRAGLVICILLLGFLTFTRAREKEIQTEGDGAASGLSERTQGDVEKQIITEEFKAAGYSLPESVLDGLVSETIKKEFGDRATLANALKERGMTFQELREQIRERFLSERLRAQFPLTNIVITARGTNGIVVTYGPTTMRADRMTVYPERGKVVAEGHVTVQQQAQEGEGEHFAPKASTNQGRSGQTVHAIEIRYVGPKSVKEADVRRRIHAQVGELFNPAEIDDDLRSLLATRLFYNVRVSTEVSSKGVDLTYNLQCNPRIAKLRFTGNSKLSDSQLQKLVRAKVGDVFNERQNFLDAQAIQKAYERAGYEGTEVKYSFDVDQPTGKASLAFEITEKN